VTDKAASPFVAVTMSRDAAGVESLSLELRSNPNLISPQNPPPTIFTLVPAVERGRWYRLVMCFVDDWTIGGRGMAKAWVDGALKADFIGPVGYNDVGLPYWKFGIYRGPFTPATSLAETLDVIYHDMQIGTASLLPRVSADRRLPIIGP
jgi:hypothetical protein